MLLCLKVLSLGTRRREQATQMCKSFACKSFFIHTKCVSDIRSARELWGSFWRAGEKQRSAGNIGQVNSGQSRWKVLDKKWWLLTFSCTHYWSSSSIERFFIHDKRFGFLKTVWLRSFVFRTLNEPALSVQHRDPGARVGPRNFTSTSECSWRNCSFNWFYLLSDRTLHFFFF